MSRKRAPVEADAPPSPPDDSSGGWESDTSGGNEELDISVDDNGRISGTKALDLNFDFFSCNNSSFIDCKSPPLDCKGSSSTIDILKRDVDAIFDGCTTFWLPAKDFEPRTTFERLARKIFEFHTRNISAEARAEIDWSKSGAEYWTQRRQLSVCPGPEAGGSGAVDEQVLRNNSSMIRFHFDKDEDLVDQTDGLLTVNPQVSTVTYLSDGGSPTLIFPHRAPPPAIEDGVEACADSEQAEDDNAPLSYAFASYPKLGNC
jgi:hypothetical protein